MHAAVNGKPVNGIGCAFSPATATFDATGKLTDQITITANARPQSAVVSAKAQSAGSTWLAASVALVFVGGVVIMCSGKRRVAIAMTCVLLFSLAAIVSCCGGGGITGGGTLPPPIPTPTPAQPVSVVVTVLGQSSVQFQSQPKPMATFTVTVQ